MSTVNGCVHGGRGGGLGVLHGQRRGSGGSILPLSLNLHEVMMKRRTMIRKRRRELPLRTLHLLRTSPRLATSSANK
jgi:hypothetical protein